jgi:hypothetical protein
MQSNNAHLSSKRSIDLLTINPCVDTHQIYQITAYANSKSSRHHTFCTPECRKAIDNYLDYRRQCGENITPKSPLLRQEFDREDIFEVANNVKPLTRFAIKKALTKLVYAEL